MAKLWIAEVIIDVLNLHVVQLTWQVKFISKQQVVLLFKALELLVKQHFILLL